MKGQREYVIFGVGLVIGLIIGYGLFSGGASPANMVDGGTQTSTSTEATSSTNGDMTSTDAMVSDVTVSDQEAGDNVSIDSLSAPFDAWVAVREINPEDSRVLGAILGAKLFPIGTASGTVTLLRSTIPGKTYYVSVYKDNGDHSFDFKNDDTLVTDADGNDYVASFKTFPATPH